MRSRKGPGPHVAQASGREGASKPGKPLGSGAAAASAGSEGAPTPCLCSEPAGPQGGPARGRPGEVTDSLSGEQPAGWDACIASFENPLPVKVQVRFSVAASGG